MLRNLVKPLLRVLTRLLFRVRVEGDPSTARADRLLVIANHESFLDGVLLGLFLPIDPVFVVHTGVLNKWYFRWGLSLVDYLAVDPTSPMAMKKIIRFVESGRPVVIFPEGRITVTGSLMKVYDGPALVAARTGATLLPVRLDGPQRSYFARVTGRFPKRLLPRMTLCIQPPTRLPMPAGGSAKERRRLAGEGLRRLMQEMLFASQPKTSLFDALVDTLEIYGRRRPVLEDIKQIEYSYGDLLKMVLMFGRLGSRLAAQDEALGLQLPNLAPTLALIIGLGSQRRTPALLNYTAGGEAMRSACRAAGVKTIISSRAFLDQAKLTGKLASLEGIQMVYLEDLRAQIGWLDKLWLLGYALRFPRACALPVDPERPAVILFTSGSEGTPKGVVLSHRAILSNIAQIRAVVGFSVEDKVLNALPLFHSFGLTGGTLLPLLSGASLFLYPSPLHYRIIPELVYDRNCTVLLGTGTFLGQYARFAHPYDFYRLRYVIAGAEKLAEPIRQLWIEKFGIRIFEGYGATETAPVLAVNTPMAYRAGTVGQFLPGIAHQLVPVPGIDQGGLLHVKGPNLMSGYLRAEAPGVLEPPASELGAGWYATGDIVTLDPEGFVRIQGRVKRFAKVAGEMISLEVVERIAALASPDFAHAATSQADPQRGENLVLFTTDPALTRERLQQAAQAGGFPELALPRKLVPVPELPLLGTGKTDYVRLKALAEQA